MTTNNRQTKMTVGDALKWGVASLEQGAGTTGFAYQEARDLLCHALGHKEAWLIAHDRDTIDEEYHERYADLIFRRSQNVPLAYSLGSAWFLGREFSVTSDTLIPRPATEHVVEAALDAAKEINAVATVDVGTGSGIIAISLALGRPRSTVWATDISEAALHVAKENAEALHAPLIKFRRGDLLEPLPTKIWNEPVAVVANLPYIPEADWAKLAPEIKDFEPKSALVSGPDGLEHYRRLIGQLLERRKGKIALCMEILPKQETALAEIVRRTWATAEIRTVRNLPGDTIGLLCVIE